MKKPVIIIIVLLSKISFCQIKSVIVDSETKEKIPYVNIWIEDKNVGTTSDKNGEFSIDISEGNYLILSRLGYENRRIEVSNFSNKILLNPKAAILDEVIISSTKISEEIVIAEFDDKDVGYYYGSKNKPEIRARFFPFDSRYAKTPYLQKLKFRIYSDVKNAKFNIRLYSIGENGEPKNPIYHKNIIGLVKKGIRNTEIDLSDLAIIFPVDGIFIGYEWLIIPENAFKVAFQTKDIEKRDEKIMYEPKVGFLPSVKNTNSWSFKNGKWENVKAFDRKSNSLERYINKFGLLAIEITLTD